MTYLNEKMLLLNENLSCYGFYLYKFIPFLLTRYNDHVTIIIPIQPLPSRSLRTWLSLKLDLNTFKQVLIAHKSTKLFSSILSLCLATTTSHSRGEKFLSLSNLPPNIISWTIKEGLVLKLFPWPSRSLTTFLTRLST